jgi:hypothetical protein
LIIEEDEYELMHYGTPRKSGRYPWGSGQTPDAGSFLGQVRELKKQGLTEKTIAEGFGLPSAKALRANVSIATNEQKAAETSQIVRMKQKGMSNTAIAEQVYGSASKESKVRDRLAAANKDDADILTSTANVLRERVDKDGMIDVSKGVENQLGIAPTKLTTAVAVLEAQGYRLVNIPTKQLGTGENTQTKVLMAPRSKDPKEDWKYAVNNQDKIAMVQAWSEDGGRNFSTIKPPISASSKKLQVIYDEDGGGTQDGVIYVRPNAKGLDMGGMKFAQVRIMVDGTHYLKGMAVAKDNLPDGVDMQFFTNKKKSAGTPLMGEKNNTILKPVERDKDGNIIADNPFGASMRRQFKDKNDNVISAINVVNEEANWDDWSRTLSSQMLSKQKPAFIQSQLEVTYANKKAQLDDILSLTNPVVKERMLRSFADDMDASAAHLKAAPMPKQKTHVILPINTLKKNEVFAPGYKDGEAVVLIRYPHGGKFEIPELVVNNRNALGRKLIGVDARTAVGIHHETAKRLSGADFDGDTVVVIPNNKRRISTESPLPGLRDFDPQKIYPGYEGMRRMKNTQTEMGLVSNLITDMTIKGANADELARAVRHSMVVIDAEKHGLNYKQSAMDNGITALRKKYQSGPQGGASTLISRSNKKVKVEDFKPRPAADGGPIDKKTGKLVFVPSGKTYNKPITNPDGTVTWVKAPSQRQVKLGFFDPDTGQRLTDSRKLIDGEGTVQERIYADYSNRVRSLADRARYEMVNNIHPLPKAPSAAKTYGKQVASLDAKLNTALKNAPLERYAQRIAGAQVKLKRAANPDMDSDLLKKVESQELKRARHRTGAEKQRIYIDDDEWQAIQAGAISKTKLRDILDNADLDRVTTLALPRTGKAMSSGSLSRARALANAGYTQAQIAEELGVSVTTLRRELTG